MIYGRVLIPLDQTSVTPQHMPCGRLPELSSLPLWSRILEIFLDGWRQLHFMIARYTFVVQPALRSRNMSGGMSAMCSLSASILMLRLQNSQNLFPHGIDVLGETDFYAVSVRRNAFLTAAPQVAKYVLIMLMLIVLILNERHAEYRTSLLNHVLNVVSRHWDQTMRELGSQSVRLICLVNLPALGPEACSKAVCTSYCLFIANSDLLIDKAFGLL